MEARVAINISNKSDVKRRIKMGLPSQKRSGESKSCVIL